MWNMRRKIDPHPLPKRRLVIEFIYPELPRERSRYWLIVSPWEGTDLCSVDPGFDVDLHHRRIEGDDISLDGHVAHG